MEEAKPQILLWTAPECPFRVTIPTTVLNEARILAVEAFYSVPRGGVEVGGVFFGMRGSECDPHSGASSDPLRILNRSSFTLSVSDQLGLSGLLDQAHADPDLAEMTALGWYHSHTRSEIFLSPTDLQLYNEFFPEKWQIAMVLRPANLNPSKAGFFFRDKAGNLKSNAPVQEFTLEPPDFGLAAVDSQVVEAVPRKAQAAVPTAVVAPSPPVTPVLVKAEAKGVPVLVSSAAAGVSLAPVAPVPTTVPEAPVGPVEPPLAALVITPIGNGSGATVAGNPAIETAEAPLESLSKPALKPVTESEKQFEIGLPSFSLPAPMAETRRTGWIWALAIAVLLIAGGGAAFLESGSVGKPPGLGLETYDYNGAFLIRWDRQSKYIMQARSGILEIEDGGEKSSPVNLSPGELAVGGYGYMRRTPQVSVHMRVDGPTPVEEYLNFNGIQALGSQPAESPEVSNTLTRALEEKEHLRTELINESMQSTALRQQIATLRRQLAEERLAEDRSKNNPDPLR